MQLPSQLLTEKDGQALAASMLEEIQSIEEANLDALSIEDQYRNGKPQNNILLDYLNKMRAYGSEAALAGFASVLTDALAFPGTYASVYREVAQEV
jgi:hypothetical protein